MTVAYPYFPLSHPLLFADARQITAPPPVLHTLTTLLAPLTNITSAELCQVPISAPGPADEETEQRLEDFERSLEENADCIRVWHA